MKRWNRLDPIRRRLERILLKAALRLGGRPLVGRFWHNPLFHAEWYAAQYPALKLTRATAERHFRRDGWRNRLDPNSHFDTAWYLRHNPDVALAGLSPLDHYYLYGAWEARNPGPRFDSTWYLAHNGDVRASHLNPLLHYLEHGLIEGRAGGPALDDSGPRRSARGNRFWEGSTAAVAQTGAVSTRARVSKTARLGVVVHLYYPELWPEIRSFLDNFDEMRLFVSLAMATGAGFDEVILNEYPDAEVRYFDNRGRDMGPFVEFLADGSFDGCLAVCKIHSKRTPQLAAGEEWRTSMLSGLMGSRSVIHDVATRFATEPRLGLLGPAGVYFEEQLEGNVNRRWLADLFGRLGMNKSRTFAFFAGSMFWFRPEAIQQVRDLGLRQTDFEPERGQIDGALQHALERVIPASADQNGWLVTQFQSSGRRAREGMRIGDRHVKLVAFYLPQFHPIPENDAWWGQGFTEWAQVTRAEPLFDGHQQPRLPAQLGFYDLRVPETRQAQADLAADFGISAFCYYFYWFNGVQLLDRPLRDVLASGQPDFPFCICWANENWTRRWDGLADDVLMEQRYAPDWSRQFIRDVLPIMRDERYLRFEGKPVLVVYRPGQLRDPKTALETWREEARRVGRARPPHLCGPLSRAVRRSGRRLRRGDRLPAASHRAARPERTGIGAGPGLRGADLRLRLRGRHRGDAARRVAG